MHQLDSFQCASAEQTSWLKMYARQSMAGNNTRVFVVTEEGSHHVVAYYAWCMAHITLENLPARLKPGAGKYPQPIALLARLGVSLQHERKGLASGLLQDVFLRLSAIDEEIGCRGLLVHAENTSARNFYTHLISEFVPSPTNELHLVLQMKDIRKTLGRLKL